MNEFMKILLSLSVSGTLLLLLVFGLKQLYKNKFSRRWQYYIWLIVALRFLLPFTPDTTIVGSLFEKTDTIMVTNETPATPSPNILVTMHTNNDELTQTEKYTEPHTESQAQVQSNEKNMTAAAAHSSSNIYVYLFFTWAVLALVLLVHKITIYQRFIRYIKTNNTGISDINTLNLLSDCQEKLHIRTSVELYHNPLIASPIMIGFFHPGIVLPVRELEDTELSYTFMHELTHYKQRDMFYKWLIQIVVCIHWFNPFVYLLEKEVNKACELSCDEAVISPLDDKAKRDYGDMLLSFVKPGNLYKNSFASLTLTEGAKQLKERLGAIMNFKKKSKTVTIITTILTVAFCFCFLVIGAYASSSTNNDSTMTWKDSEIINDVLTEDGVYYIFCDGAGENDKPQSSVSPGSIKFVLVRKDSFTSIGPFDNPKTLMEDVTKQCDYMKTLTPEEKELILETAENIANGKKVTDASPTMETLEFKGKTYYLVFNESQLRAIGTGEYGMNQNYMQQADIQLSTDEWTPIGTWDNPFTGTYNGNGYEITGLTMTDPDAELVGLFGVARDNAQIYNITLRDFDIMSAGRNADKKSVGAILAVAYGGRAYDNFISPKEEDDWNNEDWDDEDWNDEDWDWDDTALIEAYAAFGIEYDSASKSYYYEGELVKIIKDQRPDSSFYMLDINSKGTISIEIIRNTEGKITGVFYMTEEEVSELLEKAM